MFRTFQTHEIRKEMDLTGSGWTLLPLDSVADWRPGMKGHGTNASAAEMVNLQELSRDLEGPSSLHPIPIHVPCCTETVPGLEQYRGRAEFARTFYLAENAPLLRLCFGGVSFDCQVFLDGTQVGTHYGAYTGFSCEILQVPKGNHKLTVITDNRFTENSALHIANDYMSYSGILRGVSCEILQDAYMDHMEATPTQTDDGWDLKVRMDLRDVKAECRLDIVLIEEKTHKPVAKAGCKVAAGMGNVTFGFHGPFHSWTPADPQLYILQAVLYDPAAGRLIDDLIDRVGFRQVSVVGNNILLNGKKIYLKGFCRHEDHPSFGAALPREVMAQDLQLMRDLGANAVRTSHYPNSEYFLDLCDEMGFLVWEENHARGLDEEHMRNPHFEPQAEQCIREMIPRHYNHPSIIIWGILNECASDTEYGRQCYEAQYNLIRSLDQSRPRSSASCRFMNDICLDLPDIVSYNVYPEWYVNKTAEQWIAENYDWVQVSSGGAGKPFLITEIGAGAIYGDHSRAASKWSEEYQAMVLEHQIRAVFEHPGISGIFLWQFCDVRVSEEWFDKRPRTMNNKGIVDEYRRPKLAYDVVRKLFHLGPEGIKQEKARVLREQTVMRRLKERAEGKE